MVLRAVGCVCHLSENMDRVNLIFVVEYAKATGGMVQSVISIINGLSKNPHFNVVLLSPRDSEISEVVFEGNVSVLTTHSAEWRISKKHLWRAIKVSWELYVLCKPYLRERSYFISNDIGASILISLMPASKLKEIYINRGGNFKGSGLGGWFMRNKIKQKRIAYAVATSSRQKAVLVNSGMPLDRVSIIYNGVKMPVKIYNYRKIVSTCLKISTIGYISDLKNQMLGVDVIKRLRMQGMQVEFNIYGAVGSESDRIYKNRLVQHIKELELEPFVHFHGFVKGESLYSNTDILVSFSKSEGFGRTLVEGMLRKIPIIAYKGAGGPIDITANGKYGYLVEMNEVESYVKVICDILANPDLTKENVERAFVYAKGNFTENIMIKNYVSYFTELI